jgi:dTDP-glucose 4,6-dehydratase
MACRSGAVAGGTCGRVRERTFCQFAIPVIFPVLSAPFAGRAAESLSLALVRAQEIGLVGLSDADKRLSLQRPAPTHHDVSMEESVAQHVSPVTMVCQMRFLLSQDQSLTGRSSHRALRLLVSGGVGFIGLHLCDLLVRRGHRVLAVDNLFSSSAQRAEHLARHEHFQLLVHDVSKPLDVAPPLDGVLHLASSADPQLFRTHPVEIARAAALGTAAMLDVARAHKCRFLLASSDAVYGNPLDCPQTESSQGTLDPVGPRSAYDEGKRFAESLTTAYHVQWGVDTVIARIFHSYGEGMPWDGRLIPTYIANALRGAPLLVLGTGEQRRSFCHVSDLVEGILALFDSDYHGPVNLGNPREISVLSLAHLIINLLGSMSPIQFGPPLKGERQNRCPDIALATRLLGWCPRVSLEEGLRRMIASTAGTAGVMREGIASEGQRA